MEDKEWDQRGFRNTLEKTFPLFSFVKHQLSHKLCGSTGVIGDGSSAKFCDCWRGKTIRDRIFEKMILEKLRNEE